MGDPSLRLKNGYAQDDRRRYTGVHRKGRRVRGEYVRGMRIKNAWGRGRACGVVAAMCVIAVIGGESAWAQAGDATPQSQEQQNNPQQSSPPQTNPPQTSGQTQGQSLPDAPDESKKKDENANPNPVQAVADKTQAAAAAGLKKARDWESGWITGEYIGRNRKRVTPTAEQRKEIYLRETLTTPEAYLKRAFAAAIDQARGTPYQWQGGIGGYGERFASREGQFIASNILAALGNAKLGYEVRYDQCKCQGLWKRTRHAFIRNLVTYDRSEEHLRPQWALYGGAFGGGMISTAWKPGSHNPFAEGGEAMVEQVGWGTLLNFFTEFSREINRKQGVK